MDVRTGSSVFINQIRCERCVRAQDVAVSGARWVFHLQPNHCVQQTCPKCFNLFKIVFGFFPVFIPSIFVISRKLVVSKSQRWQKVNELVMSKIICSSKLFETSLYELFNFSTLSNFKSSERNVCHFFLLAFIYSENHLQCGKYFMWQIPTV